MPKLTPPLNLPAPGRRQTLYIVSSTLQSPVFLVNSRLGHLIATPSSSGREVLHPTRVPLLPKLRGEFAEFLSERSLTRLGILSLSTCVGLRYGQQRNSLEVFPGRVESTSWFGRSRILLATLGVNGPPDLPKRPTYVTTAHFQPDGSPILLRHPIVQSRLYWCRNINLLSIAYAFRPRLRNRLTLSGRTFLRKP